MAAAPPTPASTNHRSPVPPTNIISPPMPKMSTVPERCGSSSISAATTPSTSAKGSTPTAKLCIRSWFSEMMWENTSTTANFAISLGCKGPQPRQHQPPFAAVVLRHEQHRCQQDQRNGQQRPRQLVKDMVIYPAGQPHPGNAHGRIKHLRPQIRPGVAPPVERHRPPMRCPASPARTLPA